MGMPSDHVLEPGDPGYEAPITYGYDDRTARDGGMRTFWQPMPDRPGWFKRRVLRGRWVLVHHWEYGYANDRMKFYDWVRPATAEKRHDKVRWRPRGRDDSGLVIYKEWSA